MPASLLKAIEQAKKALNTTGISTKDGSAKARIYDSTAGTTNGYLHIHTDEDAWYSIITILPCDEIKEYTIDSPVVAYFVMPRYDISLAMRVGDVIIFNAKEWHALSSRVNEKCEYQTVAMHVKSKVMGKNDNSIPHDSSLDNKH